MSSCRGGADARTRGLSFVYGGPLLVTHLVPPCATNENVIAAPSELSLGSMSDPVAEADAMAPWSDWVPFDQVGTAERLPGVYMARLGPDGLVVYVGCAGPRAGGRTVRRWRRVRS